MAPNPQAGDGNYTSTSHAPASGISRDAYYHDLTDKLYSAAGMNLLDAPELDGHKAHTAMAQSIYQPHDPISEHQLHGTQLLGGPADSSSSAWESDGCSTTYSVPNRPNPCSRSDSRGNSVTGHGIKGSVRGCESGEEVHSAGHFSLGTPPAAPVGPPPASRTHHRSSAASYTSRVTHSAEMSDGYGVVSTQKLGRSRGRSSRGGDSSSGGASDDLERMFVDKVEGLAKESEKIAATTSAGTFAPNKRTSMVEMRAQVGRAPASPSSGSRRRWLPVQGE